MQDQLDDIPSQSIDEVLEEVHSLPRYLSPTYQPVESSWIAGIDSRYRKLHGTGSLWLIVYFKDTAGAIRNTAWLDEVPSDLYKWFLNQKSTGKAFKDKLKGRDMSRMVDVGELSLAMKGSTDEPWSIEFLWRRRES